MTTRFEPRISELSKFARTIRMIVGRTHSNEQEINRHMLRKVGWDIIHENELFEFHCFAINCVGS